MKTVDDKLWVGSPDARYSRHLSTRSSVVTASAAQGSRNTAPQWKSGDQTFHLVLATAFSLQPKVWFNGTIVSGDQ